MQKEKGVCLPDTAGSELVNHIEKQQVDSQRKQDT